MRVAHRIDLRSSRDDPCHVPAHPVPNLGRSAVAVACDLADDGAPPALFDAAEDAFDAPVRILVNNATGWVGITANCVLPPVTDTGWVTDPVRAFVADSWAHHHVTTPDEVAPTIAWLCSDDAWLVTGNRIVLR